MLRILIAAPTPGRCQFPFTLSLIGMMTHALGGRMKLPKGSTFGFQSISSSSVHMNREWLAKEAIDKDFTHLLFIDDDMEFAPEAVELLVNRNLPVVGVNYLIKTRCRSRFVAHTPDGKQIVTDGDSSGLQPCHYTGFGLSLIRVDVLKAIKQPWFPPRWYPEPENRWVTEDVAFFEKCQEAGYVVMLDHDASKLVTHWGDAEYNWRDYRPSEKETANQPEIVGDANPS